MLPATTGAAERVVPPQRHSMWRTRSGRNRYWCEPLVLHQNKDIFGYDSDIFTPERWLEGDIESTKRTERTILHFGAG
jgi:hypothetical protein